MLIVRNKDKTNDVEDKNYYICAIILACFLTAFYYFVISMISSDGEQIREGFNNIIIYGYHFIYLENLN